MLELPTKTGAAKVTICSSLPSTLRAAGLDSLLAVSLWLVTPPLTCISGDVDYLWSHIYLTILLFYVAQPPKYKCNVSWSPYILLLVCGMVGDGLLQYVDSFYLVSKI